MSHGDLRKLYKLKQLRPVALLWGEAGRDLSIKILNKVLTWSIVCPNILLLVTLDANL